MLGNNTWSDSGAGFNTCGGFLSFDAFITTDLP